MKSNIVCVGKIVDEFGEFYICRNIDSSVPKNFSKLSPSLYTGKDVVLPKNAKEIGTFRTNQLIYSIYKELK